MIYALGVPGPIEDVTELRVLQWHGEPGHAFAPGDLVVELETHKALVEVRSQQRGVLRLILSPEGDWQQIGRVLAVLSDSVDEPLPSVPDGLAALAVAFEVC